MIAGQKRKKKGALGDAPFYQYGGSEARIIVAAGSRCGLLNPSHTDQPNELLVFL
jgi:hypothetical protein